MRQVDVFDRTYRFSSVLSLYRDRTVATNFLQVKAALFSN